MARIKNTDIYNYDSVVSLDDYLIGSDAENSGKTKNYKVEDLISFFSTQASDISQNNLFIQKDFGIVNDLSDVSDAINNLDAFEVIDTQLVLYTGIYEDLTNVDFDTTLNYVALVKGKDDYGVGGTPILEADLLLVNPRHSQDNKNKFISFLDNDVDESTVANRINTSNPAIVVNEHQNLFIQIGLIYGEGNDNETRLYILKNLGKGVYGLGETQINSSDLQLISTYNLTGTGYANFANTQFIELGDVGGSDIVTAFNAHTFTGSEDPIQAQNVGYVLIDVTISGEDLQYLFVGDGGEYGVGGTETAVAEDFVLLTDNIPLYPSLQQVTEVGNITNYSITSHGVGNLNAYTSIGIASGVPSAEYGIIDIARTTGGSHAGSVRFSGEDLTTDNTLKIPNGSGYIPVSVSDGGAPIFADINGNINISSLVGGTQDLQSVTDIGNISSNDIRSYLGIANNAYSELNKTADIPSSTYSGSINLGLADFGNSALGNALISVDGTVTGTVSLSIPNFGAIKRYIPISFTDGSTTIYSNNTGLVDLSSLSLGGGGGASQLSDLSDVNTSTPTNRNVLIADGVDWESRPLTEADISDLNTYIPLSGTEVGSPVTGNIKFTNGAEIFRGVTDYENNIADAFEVTGYKTFVDGKESFMGLYTEFDESGFIISVYDTVFGGYTTLTPDVWTTSDGTNKSNFSIELNNIQVSSDLNSFKGLTGSSYYGANYDDNTYVQKKYVDDALTAFTPSLEIYSESGTLGGGDGVATIGDINTSLGTGTGISYQQDAGGGNSEISMFIDTVIILTGTVPPAGNFSSLFLDDASGQRSSFTGDTIIIAGVPDPNVPASTISINGLNTAIIAPNFVAGDINATGNGTTFQIDDTNEIISIGNIDIDTSQTLGVGEDNYVLTYDNATGKASFEAASSGTDDQTIFEIDASGYSPTNYSAIGGTDLDNHILGIDTELGTMQNNISTNASNIVDLQSDKVDISGTPTSTSIAVWTGATAIKGNAFLEATEQTSSMQVTTSKNWLEFWAAGGSSYLQIRNDETRIVVGGDLTVTADITASSIDIGGAGNEIMLDDGSTTSLSDLTQSSESTGTSLSLDKPIGTYYNMSSANSGTTYTTTGAVTGGWAKVRINAASEPAVTGATKEVGANFTASTDMYLVVYDNGDSIRYYFTPYTTASALLLTNSTPSSASDTGITGQIVYDTNYIYICTATDTWKRAAIATW